MLQVLKHMHFSTTINFKVHIRCPAYLPYDPLVAPQWVFEVDHIEASVGFTFKEHVNTFKDHRVLLPHPSAGILIVICAVPIPIKIIRVSCQTSISRVRFNTDHPL